MLRCSFSALVLTWLVGCTILDEKSNPAPPPGASSPYTTTAPADLFPLADTPPTITLGEGGTATISFVRIGDASTDLGHPGGEVAAMAYARVELENGLHWLIPGEALPDDLQLDAQVLTMEEFLTQMTGSDLGLPFLDGGKEGTFLMAATLEAQGALHFSDNELLVELSLKGFSEELHIATAIPSNAIPANAIPSNAIPSNAIPSNALPASVFPVPALPSSAVPAEALPAFFLTDTFSIAPLAPDSKHQTDTPLAPVLTALLFTEFGPGGETHVQRCSSPEELANPDLLELRCSFRGELTDARFTVVLFLSTREAYLASTVNLDPLAALREDGTPGTNTPPTLTLVSNYQIPATTPSYLLLAAEDPDHDVLRVTVSGLPENLATRDGHYLLFHPPVAHAGQDRTFTVGITDNGSPAQHAELEVTISISPSIPDASGDNIPPTLSAGNCPSQVHVGQQVSCTLGGIDPEGTSLTFTATTTPEGLTLATDGALTWLPSISQVGLQHLSLQLKDSGGANLTSTISFSVLNPAALPVLTWTCPRLVLEGDSLTCRVDYNGTSDEDKVFTLLSPPAGMTLHSTSGVLSWTVPRQTSSPTAILVQVKVDHSDGEDQHTFSLEVHNLPVPPELPPSLDWVPINGGTFLMGATSNSEATNNYDEYAAINEGAVHKVTLDPYEILAHEVTAAEYAECVTAMGCTAPLNDGGNNSTYGDPALVDHPVNYVDWTQAQQFCLWAGGDLPTEAQWELAARGLNYHSYPWGDTPPDDPSWDLPVANCTAIDCDDPHNYTSPVGSFSLPTANALADMAGNVREWVRDWYVDHYGLDDVDNPPGPSSGTQRVTRGGSWNESALKARSSFRTPENPNTSHSSIGFRCVR